MRTTELLAASPLRIFEWATGASEAKVLEIVLNSALFIDPDRVRETPVRSPNCVRESREQHPGKKKGEDSVWEGRLVRVCDNTEARSAFGKYIGRKMGGKDRSVSVGWEVAHIWGRVFDPEYFTAGWNMILLPGFLRVLTEEQAQNPIFSRSIQVIAYRLFFGGNPVAAPRVMPSRTDATDLPAWVETFSPKIVGANGKPENTIDIGALPPRQREYAP